AHSWFVRERQWPVDDDYEAAMASICDEVRAVRGDLDAWRNAALSDSTESEPS
ncbi:MAG: hypothetical protein ACJA0V_004461, partial [Planctomycetota bacterium]